jgi:hypothetical protein
MAEIKLHILDGALALEGLERYLDLLNGYMKRSVAGFRIKP